MELTEKDFNSYLYTSLKCKYYARYKPETARKKATEEYKRILVQTGYKKSKTN